jgi:selenocysteine lyase/cysteine desulfurase
MSAIPGRRSFLSGALGLAAVGAARGVEAPRPFAPPAGADDAEVFRAARREFLFPETVTYCNTGTLGASPREVVEAVESATRRNEAALPDWPYFQADGEPLTGYQPLRDARARVAAFLGAPPDEIAFTQNATMGMNFLGGGLDWQAGDEVVTTDQEHGGAVSIFRLLAKRRGIVVKELPLASAVGGGPEAIVRLFRDAMTPRTRALMACHVTSQFGVRMPVVELVALARERGALSLIDGAQAVGQMRVDVKALGCDAYVASPHKWLLAPKGTGLLYVRRDVQDRFWTTLASYAFDNHEDGAFRFMQYGTGSVAQVEGLLAALGFAERIGVDRIERWDTMLTRRLRDGLSRIPRARLSSPQDPRLAAAITTFRVEGVTARGLQDALWERKIRVRAQGDDKGVRLSAHLYVAPRDIDAVLETVAALGRS